MDLEKKRDVWVDNIKVIACTLVVLGHFYQSMVKTNILADTSFYRWFDSTIYYFHVPLFFICSGFLYQKYSKVNSFLAWKNNIMKKLLALGVPYFVFSLITWSLKRVFSSSVNEQVGGLFETLINTPVSPYWYLYTLFILFLITRNTKNIKQQKILLVLSIIIKVFKCSGSTSGVFIVDKFMDNWCWFVFGMCLAYDMFKLCGVFMGTVLFIVFLFGSTLTKLGVISGDIAGFVMAVLACYSVISIVHSFFRDGVQKKYWQLFAEYTMPVFLMHTLFAATFRSVLLKLGVSNAILHIVLGLAVSFCGPVLVMRMLDEIKPLDFIIYPTRYVNVGKKELKNGREEIKRNRNCNLQM